MPRPPPNKSTLLNQPLAVAETDFLEINTGTRLVLLSSPILAFWICINRRAQSILIADISLVRHPELLLAKKYPLAAQPALRPVVPTLMGRKGSSGQPYNQAAD
jgi:hypothetical protein